MARDKGALVERDFPSTNEFEHAQPFHPSAKLEPRIAQQRTDRAALGLVRSYSLGGDPVVAAQALARVLDARKRKTQTRVRARLEALVHDIEVGCDDLQR